MGYPLKQSSTEQPLIFLLVGSSDHITGLTGASPTVTLSKNGGSFVSPSGSVSEIGNGWYKVAANATDTNTLGPLVLHATATSADPTDEVFDVVGYDPQGLALSSAGLDAVLVESGITASSSLTNDAGTQLTSINARQALALVAAMAAAVVSGASAGSSSTIAFKPAAVPAGNTRVSATCDTSGNRTSVTVKVPT